MFKSNKSREFDHYLEILNVQKRNPDYDYLEELVISHLKFIPFENISKLFYFKTKNQKELIDIYTFLKDIDLYNFGGTCFSNNYYFCQLLNYLGFNAKIYGADMKNKNVHIVIKVQINKSEFLVDVGFAAPLFKPIPTSKNEDVMIEMIKNRYVLKPINNKGKQQLIYYRNNVKFHGYIINPISKNIKDFFNEISESFDKNATFMNSILLTKYLNEKFIVIQNMCYYEFNEYTYLKEKIFSIKDLFDKINKKFLIPIDIIEIALNNY